MNKKIDIGNQVGKGGGADRRDLRGEGGGGTRGGADGVFFEYHIFLEIDTNRESV